METSYKEKYEDILARLEIAKNDNDVCDERFCCVIDDLIPELAESEDEKMRKAILELVRQSSEILEKKNQERMLTWLENIPVAFDHEKREGFHLGYKACLERQGEQKFEMKTAAESLGIDSDTYNKIVDECLFGEQKLTEFERGLFDMLTDISKPRTADCVKSHSEKLLSIARKMIALEQKPAEWSEEDECYMTECINAIATKDSWSFEEKRKTKHWLKSLRPQSRWKPSSEQIGLLQAIINEPKNAASESCQIVLREVLEQLKKLKEE